MSLRTNPIPASAMLTLALALSACGSPDSWLGEQPALVGQIDAWSRGSGFTLQASALQLQPLTMTEVASAPIDDTGHFSIVLPRGDAITSVLTMQHMDSSKIPAGCTGTFNSTPADFANTVVTFSAVSGATSLSVILSNGHARDGGSPQIVVGFTYVDREVTQTGDLTCSAGPSGGSPSRGTTDIHWKAGWNQEVITLTTGSDGSALNSSLTTSPPSEEVKWTAK